MSVLRDQPFQMASSDCRHDVGIVALALKLVCGWCGVCRIVDLRVPQGSKTSAINICVASVDFNP